VILDTSALIAIARDEEERGLFLERIASSTNGPRMSASSLLEASIVIDRLGNPEVSQDFDALIDRLGIEIVPFSHAQARIARRAYKRFGKGGGHPAQLNFGDCFAYALASESGEPLLFKGADFSRTDIEAAS